MTDHWFQWSTALPLAPYSPDLLRGSRTLGTSTSFSSRQGKADAVVFRTFYKGEAWWQIRLITAVILPCDLQGNPLIPTVISFVVARLSLAWTQSHQSHLSCVVLQDGAGRMRLTGPKNVQRVNQDACQERGWTLLRLFNWSHILGLNLPEIKRECAKECGGGCNTSAFKILIVLEEKCSYCKEFNPTDSQIKQLHNADKC